jgi:hypothetical protein
MKKQKSNKGSTKEKEMKGSDADKDTGKSEGEFANIGTKQAGKEDTQEEIKGSDAEHIS